MPASPRNRTRTHSTLAALVAALAVTSLPAVAAGQPEIAFERYVLPNDLEVILHVDRDAPTVHTEVWYKVGSKDERPGRTGFAHLFEHIMFQGTKHIPEDAFFKYLAEAGASNKNGTTNFDRTNYFETVPSNQLELALWLESSRMGFLLERPSFRATFENQREVVKNERRQRVENAPMGAIWKVQLGELFPPLHPYHHEVIGSMADLDAATETDIKRFFARYYAPNNATLVVAGDLDVAAARALVEKYFGPIPRGPAVVREAAPAPAVFPQPRRIAMEAKVNLPSQFVTWTTTPFFSPGDAELDVLASVLAGGKSSRLHKRLVYDMKIAQSVSASHFSMLHTSLFEIRFTPLAGHTLAEVEAVVDQEMERVRREPVLPRELQRVKNEIRTDFFRGLEGLSGRASRLHSYSYYAGDPGFMPRDLARYEAVDAAAVQQAARRFLDPQRRLVVAVEPNPDAPIMGRVKAATGSVARPASIASAAASPAGPEEAPQPRITPDADFRARRPEPGPERPFRIPAVKRFTLANGLRVILAESHKLPLVDVDLVVRTGGAANPKGKAGLADLAADMLDEGTTTRSAIEIADQIAALGATLGTGAGWDASTVSVSALRENLEPALAIWADVLLNPSFDAKELARVRDNWLTRLRHRKDSPPQIAWLTFARAVYGEGHPYGWPSTGTEDSVRNLTAEDARAFWQAHYHPGNAVLVVAGDITEADVRARIEPLIKNWRRPRRAAPAIAVAKPAAPRKITVFLVDKAGAPQSSIRIGHVGIARKHPDYHRALVMNAVLGGSFKRLALNLREAKGWTYGVRSGFDTRRMPGPWVVDGEFVAARTADSVAEILKEIQVLRDSDVTDKELAEVKSEIVKAFPARFATISQLAGQMSALAIYDLPESELATFTKKISTVTKADVRAMARKLLAPDRLAIVVVGDRKSSEAPLRKIATLEIRDLDGNPVATP